MELFYFEESKEWDDIICRAPDKGGAEFLQSWEWGELLKREGVEILRIGIVNSRFRGNDNEGGKILAATTLIKKSLLNSQGGSRVGYFYWYAPRGPIFNHESRITNHELEKFLFNEIKKIDKRAMFLRIEPQEQLRIKNYELRIKKTLNLQPAKTLILDLTLSEPELLAAMHQKTRYNIRLAEKKGVKISMGTAADFPEFRRLLNLTGERDNFRLHGAAHYKNLIESVADKNFIKSFFARYRGRNIAVGLFCFWDDRATYMHGASDNEFRNVMAPYLLQWSAIKTAKKAGCRYYDFNGIDEKKWPGVTRFKLGFGGRVVEYPGTFDVVFKPAVYRLYNFLRQLKRAI